MRDSMRFDRFFFASVERADFDIEGLYKYKFGWFNWNAASSRLSGN